MIRPAAAGLLLACVAAGCTTDVTSSAVNTATISLVSGADQIGRPGVPLPQRIVVRVTDGHGAPLGGVELTFETVEGGGTVQEASVVSASDGSGSVRWALGPGLLQTLSVGEADARFVAEPVRVSATSERWVHLTLVSGNAQTGRQGQPLADPFVFRLTDSYGAPVPGVEVRFAITAGGGWVSDSVVRTDTDGFAAVRSTLGTGGYQRIRASIDHEYWFARYAFTYAETQFVVDTSGARWTSGFTFRVPISGTIPHDGRILESAHFLVFSDGSSDVVRQQYADMAEESLAELLSAFDIASAEVLGVYADRPDTKITIYCSAAQDVYMQAFPYGFVLYDINHSVWEVPWAPMRRLNYRNIVKHETMHVVQMLLGSGVTGTWGTVWFSEGIAEYVSGGSFYTVESWSQVEEWRRDETNINPIAIRIMDVDIPPGGNPGKYYPMFGLAVEYLLDAKGRGRTLDDVNRFLTDLGGGVSFATAFEAHMGISVDDYRTRSFDLVHGFLAIY